MGKRGTITGQCHICGLDKPLTFEHVPPKATFNKVTRYISTSLDEFAKIDNPLKNPPKGKIEQGGMGFNSLCQDCNNFLGRTYVKAYEKWVKAGFEMLLDHNPDNKPYRVFQQEPLKVMKQIISMFLSLNDPWYLTEYPELSKFVLDPTLQELPNKYRLFVYLTNEGKMRYLRHLISYSPETGPLNVSELAFPPFGFVLTMNYEGRIPDLIEITRFKTHAENPNELILSFSKLPTYLPMPLDYRTRIQIEEDIEKGLLVKQKIIDEYGII